MSTTQAAEHGLGEHSDAQEIEVQTVGLEGSAELAEVAETGRRSRRRFLRLAIGGAGVLALSASGAVALRQADAKDDDDDDDDDNSGRGSGGDDDSHGDDHGGDDHHDDDHDDDDDDDSGRGRGRGGDDDDDDDDRRAGTPVAGVTEVRITDDDEDAFEPQMITVDLGAEVTFFNDDDDDHTATSTSFDTGRIRPGESATVTLDEPGSHFYACQYHPEMTGTIFVRDKDGNVPGATPRAVETSSGGEGGETVAIRDFAFDPAELTVPVGTTVTWENADSSPHTATAEDDSFDTGRIDQNASGSVTFDEAGTFAYFCAFHPDMQGTITVE